MPSLFVPKESRSGETRVAATPETIKNLAKAGLTVMVERGAGVSASFTDAMFEAVGAKLCGPEGWSAADIVAKVAPPTAEETARLPKGGILISFISPSSNLALVARLREQGVSTLAMELVPRITRAQAMDALSSQATIAGYKAVLLGATHLDRRCARC
jgi:NAD(P) transhydrogenase subunit alpha